MGGQLNEVGHDAEIGVGQIHHDHRDDVGPAIAQRNSRLIGHVPHFPGGLLDVCGGFRADVAHVAQRARHRRQGIARFPGDVLQGYAFARALL